MKLFRRNEFIIEDIENRIIEMDKIDREFEDEKNVEEKNKEEKFKQEYNKPTYDDMIHRNEMYQRDFKKMNDTVVQGLYIMVLSGLCCCFGFLSLI